MLNKLLLIFSILYFWNNVSGLFLDSMLSKCHGLPFCDQLQPLFNSGQSGSNSNDLTGGGRPPYGSATLQASSISSGRNHDASKMQYSSQGNTNYQVDSSSGGSYGVHGQQQQLQQGRNSGETGGGNFPSSIYNTHSQSIGSGQSLNQVFSQNSGLENTGSTSRGHPFTEGQGQTLYLSSQHETQNPYSNRQHEGQSAFPNGQSPHSSGQSSFPGGQSGGQGLYSGGQGNKQNPFFGGHGNDQSPYHIGPGGREGPFNGGQGGRLESPFSSAKSQSHVMNTPGQMFSSVLHGNSVALGPAGGMNSNIAMSQMMTDNQHTDTSTDTSVVFGDTDEVQYVNGKIIIPKSWALNHLAKAIQRQQEVEGRSPGQNHNTFECPDFPSNCPKKYTFLDNNGCPVCYYMPKGTQTSQPKASVHKDICMMPPMAGEQCQTFEQRYAFDVRTQRCQLYVERGCGELKNKFRSMEECQYVCGKHIQDDKNTWYDSIWNR